MSGTRCRSESVIVVRRRAINNRYNRKALFKPEEGKAVLREGFRRRQTEVATQRVANRSITKTRDLSFHSHSPLFLIGTQTDEAIYLQEVQVIR